MEKQPKSYKKELLVDIHKKKILRKKYESTLYTEATKANFKQNSGREQINDFRFIENFMIIKMLHKQYIN